MCTPPPPPFEMKFAVEKILRFFALKSYVCYVSLSIYVVVCGRVTPTKKVKKFKCACGSKKGWLILIVTLKLSIKDEWFYLIILFPNPVKLNTLKLTILAFCIAIEVVISA